MNATTVSKLFGCTEKQARAQYAKNAEDLRLLGDRAKRIGKAYRGKTAEEWHALASGFEQKAKQ